MNWSNRVAISSLAFLLLLPASLPAATPNLVSEEGILEAADGTRLRVTTGTLRVPEQRGRGGDATATIEIAFIRIRGGDAPATTAHIVLAGGPGDSGVNLVRGLGQRAGAGVEALFGGDIIGMDQRGTGASRPNLDSTARFDLPLDQPGSPALWLPLMNEVSRSVAADFRSRGIRLEAYTTRESAADVDALRRALGYDRMTLWGRSYGTHLALAYLRQHPTRVERMILVSPEGPDHTWKLPSQADALLAEIGKRAGDPGFVNRIETVLRRLKRRPVTVELSPPGGPTQPSLVIGAFDVQWLTARALGDPRALASLPAAFRRMEQGDFSVIAPQVLMLRQRAGVDSAMKHMMDLSSGASPARSARIHRERATAILGDTMNFPGRYLAQAWRPGDAGDRFRAPVSSNVPTLILVGDLDARTPVANATEIAATLPNAQLVVVENAAHQFDVFGSPQVRAILQAFLRGQPTPTERVVLAPLRFRD